MAFTEFDARKLTGEKGHMPFYSRKYKRFFNSYEKFRNYLNNEVRVRLSRPRLRWTDRKGSYHDIPTYQKKRYSILSGKIDKKTGTLF